MILDDPLKRLFWLVKQILIIFGKIQFWLLVGLCPRVRGDDKGNFGKWASCSLALPPNDPHGANKQTNKGDRKIKKKWASCFPALPPNGTQRADIFLANLKIAHFRPFMGRLCLLKWPETSKLWPELIAEIRFLGFSYITSHLGEKERKRRKSQNCFFGPIHWGVL